MAKAKAQVLQANKPAGLIAADVQGCGNWSWLWLLPSHTKGRLPASFGCCLWVANDTSHVCTQMVCKSVGLIVPLCGSAVLRNRVRGRLQHNHCQE